MTSYAEDLARKECERSEWVEAMADAAAQVISLAVYGRDGETAIDTYDAVAHLLIRELRHEMNDESNDEDLRKRAREHIEGIRVDAANATGWRSWDDCD